mmetsp:Transcript_92786/g.251714  ORF Transcript_92786/g.251714 Transcript_92786/m.251714 type:complete len:525 (+) Transcript_92786:961-2535(+)
MAQQAKGGARRGLPGVRRGQQERGAARGRPHGPLRAHVERAGGPLLPLELSGVPQAARASRRHGVQDAVVPAPVCHVQAARLPPVLADPGALRDRRQRARAGLPARGVRRAVLHGAALPGDVHGRPVPHRAVGEERRGLRAGRAEVRVDAPWAVRPWRRRLRRRGAVPHRRDPGLRDPPARASPGDRPQPGERRSGRGQAAAARQEGACGVQPQRPGQVPLPARVRPRPARVQGEPAGVHAHREQELRGPQGVPDHGDGPHGRTRHGLPDVRRGRGQGGRPHADRDEGSAISARLGAVQGAHCEAALARAVLRGAQRRGLPAAGRGRRGSPARAGVRRDAGPTVRAARPRGRAGAEGVGLRHARVGAEAGQLQGRVQRRLHRERGLRDGVGADGPARGTAPRVGGPPEAARAGRRRGPGGPRPQGLPGAVRPLPLHVRGRDRRRGGVHRAVAITGQAEFRAGPRLQGARQEVREVADAPWHERTQAEGGVVLGGRERFHDCKHHRPNADAARRLQDAGQAHHAE